MRSNSAPDIRATLACVADSLVRALQALTNAARPSSVWRGAAHGWGNVAVVDTADLSTALCVVAAVTRAIQTKRIDQRYRVVTDISIRLIDSLRNAPRKRNPGKVSSDKSGDRL